LHREEPGFDDGLVHGHGWASSQPVAQAPAAAGYDDGLVHGHNPAWSD